MSVILMALAIMCQAEIHGKVMKSVIGPWICYVERFDMCGPEDRSLPITWHLRATHFNPFKPNELQRLTGNLTSSNATLDNSCWMKIIVDTRSNNQWKENAVVLNFKNNACRAMKENCPGFFQLFYRDREAEGACIFKPGVYPVNNTPVDWNFPNVPVFLYGYYRSRVILGKGENLYACWVAEYKVIPKPE